MFTPSESIVDLALLKQIAETDGLETVNGRYPAGVSALSRNGYIETCAVGAGGYVCWKITERGLRALDT